MRPQESGNVHARSNYNIVILRDARPAVYSAHETRDASFHVQEVATPHLDIDHYPGVLSWPAIFIIALSPHAGRSAIYAQDGTPCRGSRPCPAGPSPHQCHLSGQAQG